MSKHTANEFLVQDYLLGELRAYGLIERQGDEYVFHGNTSDYLISLKAFHLGPVDNTAHFRLREPVIDPYPPYDR